MSNQNNENQTYVPPTINNVTENRSRSKNIKDANQTVLDDFTKSFKVYDKLGDTIESKYNETKDELTSFISSIQITLNPGQNNKDKIIEQYNELKEYNEGYNQLISNNKASLTDILNTLKKISFLEKKITEKITTKNGMSNKGIRKLEVIKDDVVETREDIEKFYNLHQKLDSKITTDFNAKYTELKNNIKNALIEFYGKNINTQIINRKINKNYTSVNSATHNRDKVTILNNIQSKISELYTIYLETVRSIRENIETTENNSNLKTYQENISNKINTLKNVLSNKINDIKRVTSEDIVTLKTGISSLIEQIKGLITEYTTKHNYSNTKSTMNKLNQLVLENEFSTKGLNNAVNPIIQQLSSIITNVEGQTVIGTEIRTQINTPKKKTNTTPVANYSEGLGTNGAVSGLFNRKINKGSKVYYKTKPGIKYEVSEVLSNGKFNIMTKNNKGQETSLSRISPNLLELIPNQK